MNLDRQDHREEGINPSKYRIIAVESDEDVVQQQNLAQMQPIPLNIQNEAEIHEDIQSTCIAMKEMAREAGILFSQKGVQEKNKIYEEWSTECMSTIVSRLPEEKRIKILMTVL